MCVGWMRSAVRYGSSRCAAAIRTAFAARSRWFALGVLIVFGFFVCCDWALWDHFGLWNSGQCEPLRRCEWVSPQQIFATATSSIYTEPNRNYLQQITLTHSHTHTLPKQSNNTRARERDTYTTIYAIYMQLYGDRARTTTARRDLRRSTNELKMKTSILHTFHAARARTGCRRARCARLFGSARLTARARGKRRRRAITS